MVYALSWMPDALQRAGLKFAEITDWRTRGRADMGVVRGVMIHHTAGSPRGNMPTLDLLIKGRADLAGPLAQLGLGRDGTFYVIAAGRCNHAGAGKWKGVTTGNSSFIGIEVENCGTPADVYPDIQIEALRRGVAALLAHIGTEASMVCGHREYALPPGRKIDPLFPMAEFREQVAGIMARGVPPAPQIPVRDAQARPTLRRGAEGPFVKALQASLGVEMLGIFGPKTEAAVRALQRSHGLVPDGIVGPKSWAVVDALSAPAGTTRPVGAPLTGTVTPARPAVPVVPPAVIPPSASGALPPADDAQHPVRVNGSEAIGPDGKAFARREKLGWLDYGETSVHAAVQADPGAGQGISASRLAIVTAVSGNEGKMEAVNSWDAAFLSFGIMQWTVGTNDDPGELAALLARAKAEDAAAFAECFGRYALDVAGSAGGSTGYLVLADKRVATASAKAVFRKPEWAYRFWRAGKHPAIRRSQIRHAAARIDRFDGVVILGHPLSHWLSSELGMALLLDQHVNRPGHVPRTIRETIEGLIARHKVPDDPATWNQATERLVIDHYLDLRDGTSMTHSRTRGNNLIAAAKAGRLNAARGSFS